MYATTVISSERCGHDHITKKFGKHIQKRQLDLPEYAASFVDYKALKKLIKKLSATPIIGAQTQVSNASELLDPQAFLQANRDKFFFRLERELEKVNKFYLQKEAELALRLKTLLDKKQALQSRSSSSTSRVSSLYVTLDEGFRQFSSDLNKLQQYVELNATAFSKILKKWDKTSKSRTKELYLSRAVEVQPCFNRDVISDLSDKATTSLLELGAWAEGEKVQYALSSDKGASASAEEAGESDIDSQILQAVINADLSVVKDWINRLRNTAGASERVSRAFLSTISEAPEPSLEALLESELIDLTFTDEVNERNCLHEAAIAGRVTILRHGLSHGLDPRLTDVYGRIPLHYACIHGHVKVMELLLSSGIDTINAKDLDKFTPLIYAVTRSKVACLEGLLSHGASINRSDESDHVPLNLACQHGSIATVDLLLQHRPDILPDAEGLYPQHLVARAGRSPQLLLMLRNYGANLDQTDNLYQWTPLFHAASEGHLDCLKTLIDSSVNAEILDEKQLSAMYYATWEGHLECMRLLARIVRGTGLSRLSPLSVAQPPKIPVSQAQSSLTGESEGIPDLSLPPPIIPMRRYGHNFLDTKTFVVISFDGAEGDAVRFYDDGKYPAARLTISSKSSDLIPRNLLLPIQDEFKTISFQIDNLSTFSIDFDIYPTFGSKVIARSVASSRVFTGKASSSGQWHLELFDPRLRVIGCISFNFQVITPFSGIPLEITHFATYWRATSQIGSQPSALITGSSLSGEYVRLYVQTTSDGIPILYPQWKVFHYDLEVPIGSLTYAQLEIVKKHQNAQSFGDTEGKAFSEFAAAAGAAADISILHKALATSFLPLEEALALIPAHVHTEIHALYPTKSQEESLGLGSTPNINDVADALLKIVFEHARRLRQTSENAVRSVVFSSFNPDLCTALNWKQPNYPVLLCNEPRSDPTSPSSELPQEQGTPRSAISVKEAVRIAQNNNFMGLICSSKLLVSLTVVYIARVAADYRSQKLVPALIESIKVAGLVLISDISDTDSENAANRATPTLSHGIPHGVDGVSSIDGILRFAETIDI
ncbi:MAG: phosphate system positive regulatory protein pho81 [Bogoriella megaspora]|nr:MAG: phosphate system positive regulatory protein pho81 [Bogoriella megaspora]